MSSRLVVAGERSIADGKRGHRRAISSVRLPPMFEVPSRKQPSNEAKLKGQCGELC